MPNWSSVITNVSIPSTIAVYGNGKTLGLTDSTNYTALNGNTNGYIQNRTGGYGTQISSSAADGSILTGRLGITSDTSGNSGIVAKSNSITKISKSFKFCIKY